MVVDGRIAFCRSLLRRGARFTCSVTTNPATAMEKVKLLIDSSVVVAPELQGGAHSVLDFLATASSLYAVADRGHRHSNGISEVSFLISRGVVPTAQVSSQDLVKGVSVVGYMGQEGQDGVADVVTGDIVDVARGSVDGGIAAQPERPFPPPGDHPDVPMRGTGAAGLCAELQEAHAAVPAPVPDSSPAGPETKRQKTVSQTFSGVVLRFNGEQGYIIPDDPDSLPQNVVAALTRQATSAREAGMVVVHPYLLYFDFCYDKSDARLLEGFKLVEGMAVTFLVYVDPEGAGASEVSPVHKIEG